MGEVPRLACVYLGHLMDGDVVGKLGHPGTAQLFAPGHAEQAQLTHCLDVFPRKGGGAIELGRHGGDVGPGEVANHLANLMMLLGEIERVVHGAREPQTGVCSPAESNSEGYWNEVAVIGIGEYRVVAALEVENNPAYRVVHSQARVEAEIR